MEEDKTSVIFISLKTPLFLACKTTGDSLDCEWASTGSDPSHDESCEDDAHNQVGDQVGVI